MGLLSWLIRRFGIGPRTGTCFRVVLYCPDSHLAYNGRTPDEQGVGGRVVARVRLLKHLARLGHEVTAYVNCDRPGVYDGVEYRHFQEARYIRADVLIANTSGGGLDLTPPAWGQRAGPALHCLGPGAAKAKGT